RVTQGESRWPVTVGVAAAIAMQATLPDQVATKPRWLLPALALLLAIGLVAANPRRIERQSPVLRLGSLCLIGVISLANAWSAVRLIDALVRGVEHQSPDALLLTGGAI